MTSAADRQALAAYRPLARIASLQQQRRAIAALAWLKRRIGVLEQDPELVRLKEQRATLNAKIARFRERLKLFAELEAEIREAVARFKTQQERRRQAVVSSASSQLSQQLQASLRRRTSTVFVAEADEELAAPITLAPAPDDGAGWRTWWRVSLVDPKRPTEADGTPIENEEAGIKALAAAVVAGRAPWQLLQLNADHAQALATEQQAELRVSGLVVWSEMRPIICADVDEAAS